jgi:hypothetical protein
MLKSPEHERGDSANRETDTTVVLHGTFETQEDVVAKGVSAPSALMRFE